MPESAVCTARDRANRIEPITLSPPLPRPLREDIRSFFRKSCSGSNRVRSQSIDERIQTRKIVEKTKKKTHRAVRISLAESSLPHVFRGTHTRPHVSMREIGFGAARQRGGRGRVVASFARPQSRSHLSPEREKPAIDMAVLRSVYPVCLSLSLSLAL